jgi:hypothetical protein
MLDRRSPTQQNVDADSVPLISGQKFHHTGRNGVPYFRLWVHEMENGDLYPVMSTPDAVAVVPVVTDASGKVIGVFLLHQRRPETEGISIKATGSYCNKDESRIDAALRALHSKLGIIAKVEDFLECGESYGYGDQYNFPVSCFVVKNHAIDPIATLPQGCSRVFTTIDELAQIHRRNGFFGDETIHLIATIMLRNAVPGIYEW